MSKSTGKRKRGFVHTVVDLSDEEPAPAELIIPHSDYSTSRKDPKRQLIYHSLLGDESPALFSSTPTSQPKISKSNTFPPLDHFLSVSDAFDNEIPLGTDDVDEEVARGHMDDSESDDWDSSDEEEPGTVGQEKKKRNARGDAALMYWLGHVDTYVSELLRLDGRNYALNQENCFGCSSPLTSRYRCNDCQDSRLWCEQCMVETHAYLPFHKIKQWNGTHFQPTSLHKLGHFLPLGHLTGQRCPCIDLAPVKTLTVLDTSGLHTLNVKYCGCGQVEGEYRQLLRARLYPATHKTPRTVATFRLLEHFQLLSFVSKVSVREYCTALERSSSNITCVEVENRYRELLRMVREWRLLKTLKRHGRGHDPTGYKGTRDGECVVRCAACPLPGINLPLNWRVEPLEKRWIYRLFLAMDANFRCCRLRVSSEQADPGLIQGFQYIAPVKAFQEFLLKFGKDVSQNINTCHNHNALRLASMRRDPGLAATGIAVTECSRHESKFPNSVVDLQSGERYVNMDFTLIAVLRRLLPESALVSYDVMCQYIKNLYWRFESVYGSEWCPDLPAEKFEGAIPKFHLPAHIDKCGTEFNLNYISRTGRTNGEGPERNWSITNGLASSTKVMGPGSRNDTLDDHFGFSNWRKRTLYPAQFLQWAKKATKKRERAVQAFWEFDQGITKEQRSLWKAAVEAWEKDAENPNPYASTVKPITFHKVRLQLAQAEAKALEKEKRRPDEDPEISLASLISEGLELREQQRRLRYDTKQLGLHSTDRARYKIVERANSLRRHLDAWCAAQATLFPKVPSIRASLAKKNNSNAATDIPLLLPSDILRDCACSSEALDIQWQLEYAQAEDMLEQVRQALLQRTYLYSWKDKYSHGQRDSTRSSATIEKVQNKINACAVRYRISRVALLVLGKTLKKSSDWQNHLKELKDEDLRALTQENFDADKEKDARMSWIWCTEGVNKSGEKQMADALRIAWLKARARAHRYQEECLLLQEEMRRILETFRFEQEEWSERSGADSVAVSGSDELPMLVLEPEAEEGRRAYAAYQVYVRKQMEEECSMCWKEIPMRFLDGIGAIRLNDDVYNFV
ncbi:hypothetical protein VKT23_016159 [Stygiomarasmius scandens]|uniref:CxC2-like cysteine cluster KDZ transposase-associated domain-containing protein n=1 Tax=Marasmiellus scandens TaxID=2682957 RepID=A0ABR1J0G4_9AGAR